MKRKRRKKSLNLSDSTLTNFNNYDDLLALLNNPDSKTKQQEDNIEKFVEELKIDPETSYIIHTVDSKDTLQGLALKYCITVQEIKKANKIWHPSAMYSQKQILIPVRHSELLNRLRTRTDGKQELDKEKAYILNKFIEITNTTESEALQYLKLTNFNLDRAVEKLHISQDCNMQQKKPYPLSVLMTNDKKNYTGLLLKRALFFKILNIIRTTVH